MQRHPRVHVIALGGTISMTNDADEGLRPTLSGDELLSSVRGEPDIEVSVETLLTVPGAHLTVSDVIMACRRGLAEVEAGASGIVVVQGTDTLEESVFIADLLADGDAPFIFTGAMRHPDAVGADGPANLRDSIVAAASLSGVGSLVCMAGELHAARYVQKSHTFSPAAFKSPASGPVGWVIENRASMLVELPDLVRLRPHELGTGSVPRVVLHRASLGDDGAFFQMMVEGLNPDGVVLEGFGVGHTSPSVADAAEQVAREIPVVLASRTGAGSVLEGTYGFEGSERDLLGRGLLSAGRLDGLKARILLVMSLYRRDTAEERHRLFDVWS